jgi:hypothetical protein
MDVRLLVMVSRFVLLTVIVTVRQRVVVVGVGVPVGPVLPLGERCAPVVVRDVVMVVAVRFGGVHMFRLPPLAFGPLHRHRVPSRGVAPSLLSRRCSPCCWRSPRSNKSGPPGTHPGRYSPSTGSWACDSGDTSAQPSCSPFSVRGGAAAAHVQQIPCRSRLRSQRRGSGDLATEPAHLADPRCGRAVLPVSEHHRFVRRQS